MFVAAQVSSMKTRRLGSSAGWRRMNTRRAWATSGRSPACAGAGSARPRVGSFFERQLVGSEKPVHRTQPDGDPARGRKRTADLLQGQVGLLGNQLQHLRTVLAQPGATIAAHRAWPRLAFGAPALRPADGAADADIKPCRCPPRAAASAMKPITRSLRSCEYGAGISPPMASRPAAASPISKGLKTPSFTCLPNRKPL